MSSTTTTRSAELLERAAEVIPGGINTCKRKISPPLCIRRASGAHLEDMDGRRYIDYHAAYGAIFLGHSHPAVSDRVNEVMREVVLFGVGVTEIELAVAAKVVEHVPSVEQVLACNSGSEATLHLIRLARAVSGRQKLVKFQGGYNGLHDYVLMNILSEPDRLGRKDPHSAGMAEEAVEDTVVCRFNDLDDVVAAFKANPEQIAAVIVEPIPHTAPSILPKPGFLEALQEMCRRQGALLILDEVVTGFRHHLGGYQAIAGLSPDLTTMGKAVANGFPVALVGGKREHMRASTRRRPATSTTAAPTAATRSASPPRRRRSPPSRTAACTATSSGSATACATGCARSAHGPASPQSSPATARCTRGCSWTVPSRATTTSFATTGTSCCGTAGS